MKKQNERGSSAVEFALLMPVLVLILFGIIEFGLMLYNQQVITNASREGARVGIVLDWNSNGTRKIKTLNDDIKPVVDSYTGGHLVSFASANVITDLLSGPCTAYNTPTAGLAVRVRYQYTFLILDNLGFAGRNLTATTTMRCE